MRTTLAVLMVLIGVVLATVSYLWLAAPLGLPSEEGFSNPRVPFAPLIFVSGIVIAFASVLVYELLPEGGKGVGR